MPWWFTVIGSLAALAFGWFAFRAFAGAARARFDRERFSVRFAPWSSEKLEHPVADIERFEVDREDDGNHRVVLVTRGAGARLPVPLPLEGLRVTMRGAKDTHFGVAPREWAEHVAARLDESLDLTRRATTGLRIEGPKRVADPSEATIEAPTEDELRETEAIRPRRRR